MRCPYKRNTYIRLPHLACLHISAAAPPPRQPHPSVVHHPPPPTSIVGYAGDTTGADNNFVTIPFNTIGYNTGDIQQIRLSDDNAGGIGWGEETFMVWEGLPTVVEGSGFFYWDASMDPNGEATDYYWGDESCAPANFSVAEGQAVAINCAADLSMSTAGQVPTGKVEFVSIADNNFTGNPFPSTIDIQAISISDDNAGGIGWGEETFMVWEGLPTVVEGSGFFYWDASMDPNGEATDYYWGDESCVAATYEIEAGKGVVINCAENLTVTIAAPYSL